MKYFYFSIITFIAVFIIPGNTCALLSAQDSYSYPLKISGENRFLTDQNDKPFFWSGEAAWSLIAQLSIDDADYYLDDRQEKGFNVLLVNLIEHKFCDNPPASFYNESPFLGHPFTTPNENYFSHADSVIQSAAERGMLVLLCPLYLGWDLGDEGWGAEVRSAAQSDLRSWGQFVGNRYAKDDNIIWCVGGDTDPSPVKEKVLEMVKGIRETDTRHLFTTHNQPEVLTTAPWKGEAWLAINNVYSYSKTLYESCKSAYDVKPLLPYFMMESAYENEHDSRPQELRSAGYWPLLCGGMGHIFGNCPIWHFSSVSSFCELTSWKTQLDLAGSTSMDYLQRLFRSRPWHLLIPDFEHRVMTSGYGRWCSEEYASAALTSDGSTMIAYLPGKREVTVDMTKISGKNARCWWYEPGTGAATEIGIFPTLDNHSFTPPSDEDWVLVIDDALKNLPPPGSVRIF